MASDVGPYSGTDAHEVRIHLHDEKMCAPALGADGSSAHDLLIFCGTTTFFTMASVGAQAHFVMSQNDCCHVSELSN